MGIRSGGNIARRAIYIAGYGVGMAAIGVGAKSPDIGLLASLALIVAGSLIFAGATKGLLNERKKRVLSVQDTLASDTRPPVVYLRSFLADDEAAVDSADSTTLTLSLATEEEQLVEALKPIGPCIAIGQPGETLPDLGAARAYFADDKWEKAVLDWIDRSALVVLRAGPTPHVFWELSQVRARKQPAELIVLVPDSEDAYAPFRDRCAAAGFALPDAAMPKLSLALLLNPGSINSYIRFGPGWEPINETFPLRYAIKIHPKTRQGRPLYAVYHYAFKPVFEALGVTWGPLPVTPYMAFCMAATVVLMVWFIYQGPG